jgi:hypothetical protein
MHAPVVRIFRSYFETGKRTEAPSLFTLAVRIVSFLTSVFARRGDKNPIVPHVRMVPSRLVFPPIALAIDRLPPQSTDLVEILRKEKDPVLCSFESGPVLRRNDFQSSTKLEALIRNLRGFSVESHSNKV